MIVLVILLMTRTVVKIIMIMSVVLMVVIIMITEASPWLETSTWWQASRETTSHKFIVIYVAEIQN